MWALTVLPRTRYCTIYRPTPEQEDLHTETDAVRQDGRCHLVGQAAAFGNGRKGEDAHRHGLCPENGTRHAHDRPELRRSSRQQSESLCQDDRGVLSKIRTPRKARSFVFSDLGTYQPGDGWNVYSEIKRKLTEDYGNTAKRGALHSGVQDRQGAEGGDRRHERRDGACAVRLYLYARNGV